LGVFSLNFIIMNNIASRLGTGSVSALDWGWRLMQIPQTLVGTAMGTVIFPTLAALSGAGDTNGKRDAMSGALRFILVVCIPAAIGLILIGRPAISLLEGGVFDSQSTLLVYSTLQAFSLGLIVHSMLEVIARSFYADKDTLTPLWAALGGAAINLVLAFTLSRVACAESAISVYPIVQTTFAPIGFHPEFGNVAGLAFANSLGTTFEVVVLLILLRTRWQGINENSLAQTTLKTLVASLVMGLAILLTEAVLTLIGLTAQGRVLTIVQLIIEIGVGVLVFTGMAAALKMEEFNTLLKVLLRRSPTVEAKATAS
jgi:putative peptidoglycan lipid II flippase